jgi:hypothetical protein
MFDGTSVCQFEGFCPCGWTVRQLPSAGLRIPSTERESRRLIRDRCPDPSGVYGMVDDGNQPPWTPSC